MNRATKLFQNFLNDECGADLIEYGLIAAVLALSAITAENSLINKIGNEFNMITNKF